MEQLEKIPEGKKGSICNMQQNITGPLSYTLYTKMNKRPKCEAGNHRNLRRKQRQKPL